MKLKNKFISMLMVAAMTISAMSTVFAAGEPTIKLTGPTAAVKAGETFTVTFDVVNNPGIIGMSAFVEFDETVFSFTKATDAKAIGGGVLNKATETKKLFWNDDTAEDNYTDDATYATLTFTVAADAKPGNYAFDLTADAKNIINFDCDTVEFATAGCTVTVVGDEPKADYYAATLTWGEKAKANTGVKFNFSDSTDNKNKYAKVPFGDVTFEADSDVTVAVEVKNAPAGALTFTGAEWYLD
jgi:hypothetical protein